MDYTNLKKFFIEISDIVYKERIFLSLFLSIFLIFLLSKNYFLNQSKIIKFEVIESPKSDFYYKKSNLNEENYTSSSFSENQVSVRLFTFDPNLVSKSQLLELGFSEKVAHIFLNFRNKGGKFYKKEDVHKIFGVSDRLYSSIEPYIIISNSSSKKELKSAPQIIDINDATIEQWESLPGIGKFYATKFYTFKTNLGGFASIDQVGEIYGVQDSVYLKIKPFLKLSHPIIKKININDATSDELYKHPFLAKWQVEDILKNRPIYGLEDLFELRTFKDKSKNQRIIPYLSF